ncbi:hypothetical protein [Nibribacter koreensis]|uniref:Uncharacterized protein n=1 Tax=Nibribacter koreensis TaxID=1084519 RepID=A0ABP8G353_9BACT
MGTKPSFRDKIIVNKDGFDNEASATPQAPNLQVNISHDVINTSQQAFEESLKPFATRLPQKLILRLQQHQYWERESIMDTVINALEAYLEESKGSKKSLPEKVLQKKLSRKKRS